MSQTLKGTSPSRTNLNDSGSVADLFKRVGSNSMPVRHVTEGVSVETQYSGRYQIKENAKKKSK